MKYAVLADIHGNLPALEAVLEDAARFRPDGILVAGDHINAGPFPHETLHLLRAAGCEMIRGNGDDYLVAFDRDHMPPARKASQQWGAVRWAHAELTSEDIDFLASLPAQQVIRSEGLPPIRMVHGSLERATEGIVPVDNAIVKGYFEAAELLPEAAHAVTPAAALACIDEAVLICGHTHIPWRARWSGKLAINPGAAGAPLTGDPRAQYAILQGQGDRWKVTFRAVDYDRARVRRAYEHSGLLESAPGMARACLANVETGVNVAWFFVNYAFRLAQARGAPTDPALPDDLWNEACRTFDWGKYEG